jgi:excinuclease UvrABC ATPase subunit
MDRLATQASFNDAQLTPQALAEKIANVDQKEQELKWFSQEQSLAEWFDSKFEEAVADVFSVRKPYEKCLS